MPRLQNQPLLYCLARLGTVPGLLTDLKVTLHIDSVAITTAMDVVGGGEDAEQPLTSKSL